MTLKSLHDFLALKSESWIHSLQLDQSKCVFIVLLGCFSRAVVCVACKNMGCVCFRSIILIFELINLYIPGDTREHVELGDFDLTGDKVFIL